MSKLGFKVVSFLKESDCVRESSKCVPLSLDYIDTELDECEFDLVFSALGSS